MDILLQIVLLVVGFTALVKGADIFVDGASGIAARFRVPELVIGLTIVAMGTSAPEAAVSITAALRGSADITVGNILGSNIMNVLMVLGLTAAVSTLSVARSTIRLELPFMIVVSLIFVILGLDQNLSFTDGLILWLLFIVYLTYLFFSALSGRAKAEKSFEVGGAAELDAIDELADGIAEAFVEEDVEDALGDELTERLEEDERARESASDAKSWFTLITLTLFGGVLVVVGSNVSVDAATQLALAIGMSERLVGLTIVALGTSLPELVTCIAAARKGEAGIAIGNIVGSCLFNILFVAGTTALLTPVPFSSSFMVDSYLAVGSAILLLLCMLPHSHLSRRASVPMLIGYVGYIAYLVMV